MKEDKLSRVTISHPKAARIFTDPFLRRLLLWFSVRPRSVGSAADALQMDIRKAHYHVGRLLALGLLVETGRQPRSGRPVRLYRTVGRSFFVPFDVAPVSFGDQLSRELREGLSAGLSSGGILFRASEAGSIRGRLVLGPTRPGGASEMWRILRLRPTQADALKRDLTALLNRYQRDSAGSHGKVYLVHAALAPKKAPTGLTDNF